MWRWSYHQGQLPQQNSTLNPSEHIKQLPPSDGFRKPRLPPRSPFAVKSVPRWEDARTRCFIHPTVTFCGSFRKSSFGVAKSSLSLRAPPCSRLCRLEARPPHRQEPSEACSLHKRPLEDWNVRCSSLTNVLPNREPLFQQSAWALRLLASKVQICCRH